MEPKWWIRRSIVFSFVMLALAGVTVTAGEMGEGKRALEGSIKVQGKHSEAELRKMAKIESKEAVRIALAAATGKESDKTVGDQELEVEGGCLLYSIEIKLTGQKGVQEILIDAGNGKVLGREDEDR